MSITTGKNGYDSEAEFKDRTLRELSEKDNPKRLFKKDVAEFSPDDRTLKWFKDKISLVNPHAILEIGCGFGR